MNKIKLRKKKEYPLLVRHDDNELAIAIRQSSLEEPQFYYVAERCYAFLEDDDVSIIFAQMVPFKNEFLSILNIKMSKSNVIYQLNNDKEFNAQVKGFTEDFRWDEKLDSPEKAMHVLNEKFPSKYHLERANFTLISTQDTNSEMLFMSVSPMRFHDYQRGDFNDTKKVVRPIVMVKMSLTSLGILVRTLENLLEA